MVGPREAELRTDVLGRAFPLEAFVTVQGKLEDGLNEVHFGYMAMLNTSIRPPGWRGDGEAFGLPGPRLRLFHRQKRRKPQRCQASTVWGWTITRACRQPGHSRDSQVQKNRSTGRNRGRVERRRCNTASC